MRILSAFLVCAAAFGFASCGGGSGASIAVTVSLFSNPGQQGSVNEASGTAQSTTLLICGDFDLSPPIGPWRFLVTFDHPTISGGSVTSAVLSLGQVAVAGSPYTVLGTVLVDHVDYGDGPPDSTDFLGSTLTSNVGTLSSDPTLAVKSLDVSSFVQADRTAGRTRSQFRVRFSPVEDNGGAIDDNARFEDANNGGTTGQVPLLQIVISS